MPSFFSLFVMKQPFFVTRMPLNPKFNLHADEKPI
jgi:hypothetical protein